ncbi:NirD/YgiW/YdeI family stress tolerance protein [Sphingomonas sp.]|uniref:NirD/YgiW/YdeI family stress tolerance protein n=1 Tax=Sphingomonas sp. TaxID=28214 RepID=UPI002DBB6860|nr:NirD/YgiW/YdeI family stress tolerance protein [Sphingomonas sp.]HEU4968664.1 NirD/YgiW/YdeI family stress tolerance protein [Sphingomonas sp.]
MKHVRSTLAMLLATAALCGCSEENKAAAAPAPTQTGNAQATRVANAANNSWLTLNGKVTATTPTSFDLDYGSGRVTVEMDDWDWFQEGRALKPGDQVMVTGRVDNDLFEKKKIEAASVYVENLGTHFFANPGDEEDLARTTIVVPQKQAFVGASGFVTEKEGTEFEIGGPTGVRIDVAKMPDNPLDAQGLVQVKVGDRVQVWGDFNADPDERPEIMAKGLIVLASDQAKAASGEAG